MKNKKGFSLIEIMTVVIILGILASLSIPFLIGYVRDAKNDKAKAVLFMVAQGYKNFKSDFSYFNINTAGPLDQQNIGDNINTRTCNETFLNNGGETDVNFDFLIKCSFLPNVDYDSLGYNFYVGSSDCNACGNTRSTSTDLACMVGKDTSGDYCTRYCAFIDHNNNLHEVKGCNAANAGGSEVAEQRT